MTTLVVIGNGDVFRFSHPFLSLCPLRPRHSGVTGAPTALCFCTHPPHPFFFSSFSSFFFFFSFSPGGVSWRHTTPHDAIGLKYLEPSCSAGGRDLVMPLTSECLSLRAAAAGDDDLGRHRKW